VIFEGTWGPSRMRKEKELLLCLVVFLLGLLFDGETNALSDKALGGERQRNFQTRERRIRRRGKDVWALLLFGRRKIDVSRRISMRN